MCCKSLRYYMWFLCVFFPKESNNSDCFVLTGLISGYCPSFWDTLSLMRKSLYKHLAYLCLYGFVVSYLLSVPGSSWAITIQGKLAVCQACTSQDSLFEEKQRSRKYLWIKVAAEWEVARVVPLHLLKKEGILVKYSQIKASNDPLFCYSAKSSISVSFIEMELVKKGQRFSFSFMNCGAFSLLSDNAAVTVVLFSWGGIKGAIDFL